jgi:hypothetical protein
MLPGHSTPPHPHWVWSLGAPPGSSKENQALASLLVICETEAAVFHSGWEAPLPFLRAILYMLAKTCYFTHPPTPFVSMSFLMGKGYTNSSYL